MGSPISPLGNVTNPLGSVIDGLLQGHELGLRMRQQQNQDQEEQLRQALGQQKMQADDEASLRDFLTTTRPVINGMVRVPKTHPQAMAATPGTPDPQAVDPSSGRPTLKASSDTTPDDQPYTLGQLMPTMQPPVLPPGAAAPANVTPPQLPQASPSALPNESDNGHVLVKVNPSLLVRHKDRNGNVTEGQLFTPQEQLAARVAQLTAERDIPFAKDKPNIDKGNAANALVQDPADPTKQIRQGELAAAQKAVEQHAKDVSAAWAKERDRTSKEGIAADKLASSESLAKAREAGQDQRASEHNDTVLEAARIHKTATAGAKQATPTQLNGIRNKMKLSLAQAEGKYQKAMKDASVGGFTDTEKAAEALTTLHQAKQGAQDTFEDSLSQFGIPVEHFDYSAQTPKTPDPPKTDTPTTQTAPPPATKTAAPAKPGSKGKLTDKNIAAQYGQKAGGDKQKARALAMADGWTF